MVVLARIHDQFAEGADPPGQAAADDRFGQRPADGGFAA